MHFKLLLVILIKIFAFSATGQEEPPVGTSIDVAGGPIQKNELKKLDGKQVRTGQPASLSSRINQLEAEFREKIDDINTKTSKRSEDQDEKIAIIRAGERNLAKLLNQTREEMEALKTTNRNQAKRIDQLEQKIKILENTSPSPQMTRANTKDKIKEDGTNKMHSPLSKAPTPPSSCHELFLLDYYLDGLYLVKNKKTKKIETLWCQFQADNKVTETMIGTVDIKTKSVHFYVQRNSSFGKKQAIIPFELARLNEGEAMNLTSGIFTVPVPGLYHFELSAQKDGSLPYIVIFFQVNGKNTGLAETANFGDSGTTTMHSLSLTTTLRLKVNDTVNLLNWNSGIYDDVNHHTHFTGWLVEEELK